MYDVRKMLLINDGLSYNKAYAFINHWEPDLPCSNFLPDPSKTQTSWECTISWAFLHYIKPSLPMTLPGTGGNSGSMKFLIVFSESFESILSMENLLIYSPSKARVTLSFRARRFAFYWEKCSSILVTVAGSFKSSSLVSLSQLTCHSNLEWG